jgi:uroporphyrinogen III methyltransferase/synthase
MPLPESPLSRCSVLLTRPAGRAAALARQLRLLGARVVEGPTIAFEDPADLAPARRAIEGVHRFDWLVFSSATGVDFFAERLRQAGLRPQSLTCRLASVGTGTAERLETIGMSPDVVAAPSHAEGLAESMRMELRPGERVLWVRPEAARPVLAERLASLGAEVEGVAFYRTIVAPGAAAVAESVRRDGFDVVVFTSPSTFLKLLDADPKGREAAREALARCALVAIGPITAAALEREGLKPAAVAVTARVEAIVEAICEVARL